MRKAFCWKDERLELEKLSKNFFLTLNFWGFYHLCFLLPVLVAFRLMNWLVFLLIYLCTNERSVKLWVIFKYVRLCWNHGNRNLLLFIWISRYSFSLALSNTVAVLELQLSRCCQFFAATLEGSSRLIMRGVFLLSSCHLVAKCGRL